MQSREHPHSAAFDDVLYWPANGSQSKTAIANIEEREWAAAEQSDGEILCRLVCVERGMDS